MPRGRTLDIVAKDDLVEVDKDPRSCAVRRVRFRRDLVWEHWLPEEGVAEATLLVDDPGRRVHERLTKRGRRRPADMRRSPALLGFDVHSHAFLLAPWRACVSLADSVPFCSALYVAHYSAIGSGATLYGLDLATGARRWVTSVHGLGPIEHEQYYNHVTLKLVRGALVAFGDEAQGRYIEVFVPESGRMRSTRVLSAAR